VVGAKRRGHYEWGDYHANTGQIFMFQQQGNDWVEIQNAIASDRRPACCSYFGVAVAIENGIIFSGAHGETRDQNGSNYLLTAGSAAAYQCTGRRVCLHPACQPPNCRAVSGICRGK
jgi:hypothetical protein